MGEVISLNRIPPQPTSQFGRHREPRATATGTRFGALARRLKARFSNLLDLDPDPERREGPAGTSSRACQASAARCRGNGAVDAAGARRVRAVPPAQHDVMHESWRLGPPHACAAPGSRRHEQPGWCAPSALHASGCATQEPATIRTQAQALQVPACGVYDSRWSVRPLFVPVPVPSPCPLPLAPCPVPRAPCLAALPPCPLAPCLAALPPYSLSLI
jgi:hypothetical protein